MAVHTKRREPRAHWVLLVLGLVLLLGELCLSGYVNHVGAEGSGPRAPAADRAPAPRQVLDGGPVLRLDADGKLTSSSVPSKTIALTFDDGPDPTWTPQILDVLARHHAHATFFVIGSKVNEHPELVRRMLAEGDDVGLHTFTHAELITIPQWRRELELNLSENALAGAAGVNTVLLRPPYSSEPDAVSAEEYDALSSVAAGRYLTVLADLDTEDWRRPGVAKIVANGTPAKDRGAVVMLHDGGGDRSQTVAALDDLLTALGKRGYTFTTVTHALGLPPATTNVGTLARLRGQSLLVAQRLAMWLTTAMVVLLSIALALGVVRLLVQVIAARVHARRARRRREGQRLRYLGPVSIVVPAYNEAANIAATVRSLVGSDYPDLEVIVVDDGSTDGTAEIVRSLRLRRVRVVRQANAGKPAALNTGIARAAGEIIVLVDGDTVFARDAVGRLVQPFADAAVGAVSGNTKVANRKGLLGRWQHLEYVVGFNLDRRLYDLGECMPTVPGAIGAFRREVLDAVGGVPAATLAEDTDLTMAVLRRGWRVVYEETAVAWTEAPSSLRQLWRQRYRWCYGTMQAIWKHRASLVERGPSGKLGRRGLLYLVLFQILLPLAAPAVDVYAVYGLIFLPPDRVAMVWLSYTAVQMFAAGYALRLDRERLRPLWSLPLQLIVYRQLMYLVTIQSTVTALTGIRLRWQSASRTGDAEALLVGSGGSWQAAGTRDPGAGTG
ncbi:MAG TPA: bifunctional polysaccharide deacetylase/glycosyltransferase family 2 protein [Micromonosporaceae bacterium]|jgi:cellulose synthase/poly-beta-1,6-N-acetylglucosamine synthase-like glycosyltransferase/peptidoglycan/xylan/chitin deacetylase (PgdA/CDA1 family)